MYLSNIYIYLVCLAKLKKENLTTSSFVGVWYFETRKRKRRALKNVFFSFWRQEKVGEQPAAIRVERGGRRGEWWRLQQATGSNSTMRSSLSRTAFTLYAYSRSTHSTAGPKSWQKRCFRRTQMPEKNIDIKRPRGWNHSLTRQLTHR